MNSAKILSAPTFLIALITSLTGCLGQEATQVNESSVTRGDVQLKTAAELAAEPTKGEKLETITLGAGCFWCIEAVLERVKGIGDVQSGYCNGETKNPTYKEVCSGTTGHVEVVKVEFDPDVIPLEKLLDLFFELHDPTTLNRQGADRGTQYRSGIYYHNDAQKKTATAVAKRWNESGHYKNPIVTEIVKAEKFYPAEDYHQDYFRNQPNAGYCRVVIYPKLKKLGMLKDGR